MDDERDHRPPRWPISVVDVGVSLAFVAAVAGALAWFVRTYDDASLSIAVPGSESPWLPVSGMVTLDGKPLADADVIFIPSNNKAGIAATGVTDQAGRYRLKSASGNGAWQNGALQGGYYVKFSRMVNFDGTVLKPPDPSQGPYCPAARESIPTDYSLKASFTVEVTKDKRNGYDFALTGRTPARE